MPTLLCSTKARLEKEAYQVRISAEELLRIEAAFEELAWVRRFLLEKTKG